jgi:hypothetical protein
VVVPNLIRVKRQHMTSTIQFFVENTVNIYLVLLKIICVLLPILN